ncbi:zinc-ribbon domain-containing protein [Acidaminobacter sp. JC074]|uniref:zinc-ribbon domain-containing protein n=1 Tax=Acidaminobacter sp. JC074 TaxID=2530199 RepID=UPI001F0DED7B|nr:zinc-ribbon domain-containing protein [Acidaminobacter sp. JC074]MCH4887738.1 zinc-ribbon domain-containing protein [Acidaminobacter sp. JC074]
MFILGFGRRDYKVLGETEPRKCKSCSHERPFKYVEEKRYFSLLFIPLFPYKTRNLMICGVCGAGVEDLDGVSYHKIGPVKEGPDKESIIKSIKEKLDRGEISRNEYIRMINVLKFETSHTH